MITNCGLINHARLPATADSVPANFGIPDRLASVTQLRAYVKKRGGNANFVLRSAFRGCYFGEIVSL
jgi:hypothetical protein